MTHSGANEGMTLRDYFAAKAMQGLIVGALTNRANVNEDVISIDAFTVADSMLKARQK